MPYNTYIKLREGQNLIHKKCYDEFLCNRKLQQRLTHTFTQPTPLESIVLPLGFEGKNLIIQAKDGASKTRCFSTLAANVVFETPALNIAVIIVTPIVEDVYKIRDVLGLLIDIPILTSGGDASKDAKPLIGQWYPVIIAVPKMLSEIIQTKTISVKEVSMVIISKADLYSDMVIENDMKILIDSLTLSATQFCIFSNGEAKKMYDCMGKYLKEPYLIQFGIQQHRVTPHVEAEVVNTEASNPIQVVEKAVEDGPKKAEKKEVRFDDTVETKKLTDPGTSHDAKTEKDVPKLPVNILSPLVDPQKPLSPVFDYAVIEIGRHPATVIKDLLTNINFNQVVIFADDYEMCTILYETLTECTYKVEVISTDMSLSETDHFLEEFKNQQLQVIVSKDISICEEDMLENVDLVVSVGVPDEVMVYLGRINQTHGASLNILTNVNEFESFVFDFCNHEVDIRGVRLDDMPDDLTVNRDFFNNSVEIKKYYNRFVVSYQSPSVIPANVVPESHIVPKSGVKQQNTGKRELQIPKIQFLVNPTNKNSSNARKIFNLK